MIAKKLLGRSASLATIAATLGMIAAPLPALAQASPSPGGGLDLPTTINMLGSGDPNVRTATAIVNGAVVTGTDVDHRLALTVDAAQSAVPETEVQRLRGQILRNLIDETLKIQAAAAQEMGVSSAEVDQRYAEFARERGQSLGVVHGCL